MQKSIFLMALAGSAAIAAPAAAATFTWTGGTYVSGVTSPNPLAAADVLNLTTGSSKSFDGSAFTNNGTVNWADGYVFLTSSSAVTNNGIFNATGDNGLDFGGGGASSFTNSGTFRKSAGAGTTTIGSVGFANSGTIDAQTGTLSFSSAGNVFNAGSIFTGAGTVSVSAGSAFNGGFTASNLVITAGTQTGTAAALSGSATWQGGALAGSWSTTAGSTLGLTTGASKSFDGSAFTNNGTMNWADGNVFLTSGSAVTNNGTVNVTGDNTLGFGGGGASSFTNKGLITKVSGAGTTTIGAVGFDNLGTVNVSSGTIALPGNFVNNGTLSGTGTFSVAGTLTNNGTIAPGNSIGTLSLSGNYLQSATGSFAADIGPGTLSDLFLVSGTATLNGGLNLFCASCALQIGDIFTILDSSGDLLGTFGSVTTSGFLSGFAYNILYDYALDRVQLEVLNPGMPGGGGAIPEPATWAMLIAGFGLVGAAARRRRTPEVAAG